MAYFDFLNGGFGEDTPFLAQNWSYFCEIGGSKISSPGTPPSQIDKDSKIGGTRISPVFATAAAEGTYLALKTAVFYASLRVKLPIKYVKQCIKPATRFT